LIQQKKHMKKTPPYYKNASSKPLIVSLYSFPFYLLIEVTPLYTPPKQLFYYSDNGLLACLLRLL